MSSAPGFDVTELDELLDSDDATGEQSLMAVLERVQARYRYLPEDVLILLSERMGVPLSQTYSVATFYNAFSLEPKGEHVISVCMGTACNVRGSRKVLERISDRLGIGPGETTEDNQFTLETVNCLGACALGPIAVVDGDHYGQMTAARAEKLLKEIGVEGERA